MRLFPLEREMRSEKDFGRDLRHGCGNPLAYAGTVWHRVIINKESTWRVAADLGFQNNSIQGIARILKACGYCPSAERMAVVAMIVPDVTDADVAEWFDRPISWAAAVRAERDDWRASENFPLQLEYIDDGYTAKDPSPEEIAESCKALLAKRPQERTATVGVRNYQWNGKRGAFVSLCTE